MTWPHDPSSKIECRVDDENYAGKQLFRFFYYQTGEPCGFGELQQTPWSKEEDNFSLSIIVDPKYRRQGLGGSIYEHLINLETREPVRILQGATTSLEEGGRIFLEKKGFHEATREIVSAVNLNTWSAESYAERKQHLSDQRVDVFSYAEYSNRGFSERQLYALWSEVDADVPWHEEHVPESFEQWKRRQEKGAVKVLDAHSFLAAHRGELVGLSALVIREGAQDCFHTGLTGVLAGYRRRGIAIALKVHSLESVVAKAEGISMIWTENEERNPMYAINQKLGFKRHYDLLFYQKQK